MKIPDHYETDILAYFGTNPEELGLYEAFF